MDKWPVYKGVNIDNAVISDEQTWSSLTEEKDSCGTVEYMTSRVTKRSEILKHKVKLLPNSIC